MSQREENLVKQEMLKSANKVDSTTISNKLMTRQTYSVCDIDKLDYLIAKLDLNIEILRTYKVKGVMVIRLLLTFLTKELK